jgi:DNA replication and repair protein RecF
MNCFIGHNGEGKTNLLDAVYYLSFCRSANNAVDSQLINHDQDFFVVEGEYGNDFSEKSMAEADENRLNIYCGMKRGTKKHFKRDGKAYSRLSDHIGLIPVVFVSPADTMLIDGVSEDRRRLMDMVISQYDRSYIELLSGYNKALQQRNALLRMEQEPDLAVLEIWEQQMAVNGEKLYEKRKAFVDELIPIFQRIYQQIAAGKEQVSLRYVSHCERGPLLDVIQRDRAKDRVVGYSLHGVHRDELEMLIDGYPVRREGSQGQHKTFVIALKLAQFDFLKRTVSATTPLLLLDDIFDKLDAQRVERIVRLVSDDGYGQIFITDTNRQHLDQILSSGTTDYKLFRVDNGVISEQIP